MVRTCTPRTLLVLSIAAAVALPLLCPLNAQAQIDHDYVPGEVIVKFASDATQADVDAVLGALQAVPEQPLNSIQAGLYRIGTSVEDAVASYAGHAGVEYIEPNYLWYAEETPNDPRFGDLWGLQNTGQTGGTPGADISATHAWDIFKGSASVLVGVIDTGVDITHPDLAANIYTNPGEIAGNGIDDDGNGFIDDVHGWDFANDDNDPFDDVGHGTHVSGTIGAVGDNGVGVVGVNWTVTILPIKFLAPGGGTTTDAVASVEYATMMGVDLTNNSWGGGPYSEALRGAIDAAGQAGILFVAAAGNESSNTDVFPHYPSSYDLESIVSVAATNHNDDLAGFSNYGIVSVDLAAPGQAILSTLPGSSYGVYDGTSMATPHVTGVLALMKGFNPSMPAASMRDFLLANVDPVPALSGLVATGGRLNAFAVLAEPDSIPPAAVDDLTVLEVTTSNGIRLQWTATGDDGLEGTASYYDVRYSTSPIDEMNFDAATEAVGEPDPGPPGTVEETVVEGVDFATTYYLAVKVLDEFGNTSPLSNVVSTMTLGAPDIAVSPPSFSEALLTGATSTQTLTLENAGASDLTFDLTAALVQAPSATKAAAAGPRATPRASDPAGLAPDETAGTLVDRGAPIEPARAPFLLADDFEDGDFDGWLDGGGPWPKEVTSDTAANGTHYSYHDTDGGGHFYGKYQAMGAVQPAYISFWVRSGSTATSDAYVVLHDSTGYEVIWFFARGNGFFYVNADVGGSETFTYSANTWYHVEFRNIDFEVKTFDYYVDGTLILAGIPFRNAPYVDDLYVVDIYNYASGSQGWWDEILISSEPYAAWLSLDPATGVVPAGGMASVDVTFDATGLIGGGYDANILINSNDPDEPSLQIPAHLDVTGAPDIHVDPTSLDFGTIFQGSVAQQTLEVCNPGTDLLQVTSITSDSPFFSADLSAFDLVPGACQDVVVSFSPTAAGPYAATLTLASNDPDEAQIDVGLAGEAVEPPDIEVSPTFLNEALFTGETSTQTVTISNVGVSPLEFSLKTEETLPSATQEPRAKTTSRMLTRRTSSIPTSLREYEVATGQQNHPGSQDATRMGAMATYGAVPDDVLLYADHYLAPPGGQPIDFALQSLGMAYTAFYSDVGGFANALVNGTWDLVLIDENSYFIDAPVWNAVEQYVLGGGRVLISTFYIGATSGATNLWHTLGVEFRQENDIAVPVYWWEPSNRLFNSPESVPEFLTMNEYYFDDGDRVDPIAPASVVAGFTQAPTAGQGGIVLGKTGRSIVNSFLVVENESDLDQDGKLDAIELYINEISYLVKFVPWLVPDLEEGTVLPGESVDVQVTFDATGLFGGAYDADLVIDSNDPDEPQLRIPAHLDVTGRPEISIPDTALAFGSIFVGGTSSQNLTVSNLGTDVLAVSAVTSDDPDFTASSNAFDLAPGESQDVQITFAPSRPGPIAGTLSIASNDPLEPVVEIALGGEGVEPPDVAVSPAFFDVSLVAGTSTSRLLTLQNEGVADLLFQVSFAPASSVMTDAGPLAEGDVLEDGFEDGDLSGWLAAGVGGIREVTSATAAHGTQYSYHESFSVGGHLDGIYQTFSPVQLQYVSFWVRSGSTATNDGYVVLRDAGGRVMAQFFARDDGRFFLNAGVGGSESFAYDANTWYHIELREIDFTAKTMNFYVDGQLVQIGVPFRNTAIQKVSRVDLYNYTGASQAWWDEIRLSTEPLRWLILDPEAGTIAAGDSADVVVTFDAQSLDPGSYGVTILVESNDPDEPEVSVPAHLEVLAAGCEKGDVIADGEVNSADAIRGLLIAIDVVDPTPQELCAADMNLDGSIEVGDVVLILQKAVGTAGALGTGPALSTGPAPSTGPVLSKSPTPSKSPAQLFARAGDEIGTVELRVAGAAGLDLVLTYDPSAVSFDSFTAPGSKGLTAASEVQPGTLRVGFARDTAYDGDLVLRFEVSDTSSPLRFVDVVAYDGSGGEQPVELSSGEFFFGVTGVDAPSLGKTRLLAAVPNPFNPRTRLRFVLSSPGDARLTIFNVAGRRVKELSLRQLSAGEHFVTWDGRDDAGARVASGSYLIRFEAKGTTDTGRILLLK